MLKKAIRLCFYWGMGIGCFYSFVFWVFGEHILWMLSSQIEVVETAKNYLWWLVLFPVIGVFAFVWDGIFIGVTATKAMRNTMLISSFVVFLPAYFILHPYLKNNALWAAFMLFTIARGVTQTIISKRVVYHRL